MKKRLSALFLALALSLTLTPLASAAEPSGVPDRYGAAAEALWKDGLFLGSGNSFNLDQPLTRAAGVTMVVRLLGKDAEAKSGTFTTPFTDVPDWAAGYVGYAYTNGLTQGTSATTFGSTAPMSAAQYLTLTLRARGYDDKVGDFRWDKAAEKALSLGLVQQADLQGDFLRGQAALISYNALAQTVKGTDKTLKSTITVPGKPSGTMPSYVSQPTLPAGVDPEVGRAIKLGLVPAALQGDYGKTATEKELCTLMGNAVAKLDAAKLPAWNAFCAAATDGPTLRQEAAVAMYLAATLFTPTPQGNASESTNYLDWEKYWFTDVNGGYGGNGTKIFAKFDNREDYTYLDSFNYPSQGVLPSMAMTYALELASRYSHNLALEMKPDGSGSRFKDPLTREEAILAAVRWYDSWDPAPVYVTPEDVRATEQAISAAQLETSAPVLPVTAEKLPAWKGGGIGTKGWAGHTGGGNGVQEFYESDVKYLADHGFNFMRVHLGFTTLGAPDYPKGEAFVNLRELEDLDQLLAWGLRYGVHMQISMCSPPKRYEPGREWTWDNIWAEVGVDGKDAYTEAEWADVAACWKMLALRYQNVPTDYLSFELGSEWHPDDLDAFMGHWNPIIDSIRAVTPNRVLLFGTDDSTYGLGMLERMAQRGVALTYHAYEPRSFVCFQYDADTTGGYVDRNAVPPTWPYTDEKGVTWSGEKIYETYIKPAHDVAKKYNVGFMVNEVGLCNAAGGAGIYQSDAVAYTREIIAAMNAHGVPYNHFYLATGMGFLRQYYPDIEARRGETMTPVTYHFADYDYSFYADLELTKVWTTP